MSYLVLARKWRPQTFAGLVGQEHVARTLQNAIRTERVAHAFLFCGMRGIGKTTAARLLAKALNCEQGPTPTPCNECSNCREITAGGAVDVLEIDGASNRGINEVRQIIENVRYQPAKSRFKIYIIDEVHQVTHDAFNALLKTLEEPPPHVKFILATTEAHRVPHTILSRCQRYDFKRIATPEIARRLAEICQAENVEVSQPVLMRIAREAEGSMRDAQSLLDQAIAFAGKTLAEKDVTEALGIADRNILYAVADAVVERNPAAALEQLGELHRFGYDLRRFARELVEHFRNVAVAQLSGGETLLSGLSDEEKRLTSKHAGRLSPAEADRAFRVMLAADEDIARSPHPKLLLEMSLIKLATLPAVVAIDDVLEKLDQLARGGAGTTGGSSLSAGAAGAPRGGRGSSGRQLRAPAGEAAPAATQPAAGATPQWQAFLAFVGKEKRALTPHLQQCVPTGVGEERLEVTVPPGFHHDYLARREHHAMLEKLARRFYGRELRLTIRSAESAGEEAQPKPTASDLTREALSDPAVQAAVDILGGEIQEVKPRTGPERTK